MKPGFGLAAILLFMVVLYQCDLGTMTITSVNKDATELLRRIRAAPVNRRCRLPIGQPSSLGQPPAPDGQARPPNNQNNPGNEDCEPEPVRRIPRQIEIQAARRGSRRDYRFERITRRRTRKRG